LSNFVQSAFLRNTLISVYRLYDRSQVFRTGPRVFVNSIPKAGTHLVTARLDLSPAMQNSRLWIRKRFVNANAPHGMRTGDFSIDIDAFNRYAGTVRPGQFFTGHLEHSDALVSLLHRSSIRTLFVKRHPLDVLVSNFHYITGLKRHSKHSFFAGLPNDDERIRTLIKGSDTPHIPGLAEQIRAYQDWETSPSVLSVRFEDLVGSRGGGDDLIREQTMAAIFDHIGVPLPDLESDDNLNSSATFRKGQIYRWAELLTPARMKMLGKAEIAAINDFGYRIDLASGVC